MKAGNLLLSGDIEADDYKAMKLDCEQKIRVHEAKLGAINVNREDIDSLLEKVSGVLSHLDELYVDGSTVVKREIVCSMFPENLIFDGFNYRTPQLNEAVRLIYTLEEDFRENKNGTSLTFQTCPIR